MRAAKRCSYIGTVERLVIDHRRCEADSDCQEGIVLRDSSKESRIAARAWLTSVATLLVSYCIFGTASHAQTRLSNAELSDEIRLSLSKQLSLELRDATLLDAIFTVRDASGLNIVVGNEVKGTVNASYSNSPVYDILDSLLITRGYGYRVVGSSIAIVPLESLGDQLPLFETEVISLISSEPTDLMPSVESMLSPEGRAHAVASSHSIVVVDYPQRIDKIRKHIDTLENAAARFKLSTQSTASTAIQTLPTTETQVRVFRPQYVNATVLSEAIVPLLTGTGRAAAIELEDKLVVSDTPEALARVEKALEQLDQPRPQVRIWALIYDCGIEDLERLGVNWRSGANSSSIDAATGNPAQSILLDTVTSTVSGGANGALTLSSLNSNFSLTSVIQALNTADDSRLLADPNVVVMNHEPAEIAIVTEVPYQQLTQGLEGGTIGTTEFREAGVTLNVTPHIAQDETISLLVNPQFSLLTGFSEPDNAPIIDRRETKTTVRVANNQTIVLGGLRQRTRIINRNSIPFFGKVPYVGQLFRNRSTSARESELLVFITPQIVHPDHLGTERENCISRQLQKEIDLAPTGPIPFGHHAIKAEVKAYADMINHPHATGVRCNHKRCQAAAQLRLPQHTRGMICTDHNCLQTSESVAPPAVEEFQLKVTPESKEVRGPTLQDLNKPHVAEIPFPTLVPESGKRR